MRVIRMSLFLLIGCLCYVAASDVGRAKKRCPGKNQENRPCGTYWFCEPTCKRPEGQSCPRICVEGCFCKENYIRERPNGTCIREEDC